MHDVSKRPRLHKYSVSTWQMDLKLLVIFNVVQTSVILRQGFRLAPPNK